MHLLKWDTITLEKNKGGFGVKKAKSKNLALLTSLAWRLINYPLTPWATVLRQTYLSSPTKRQSFYWKNFLKGWHFCLKGCLWQISRNSSLGIWDTKWIPCLRNIIEGPLTQDDCSITIKDLITHNTWSLDKRSLALPNYLVAKIQAISLPIERNHDFLTWEPNSNGLFSTSSCYNLIEPNETP